MNKAGFSGILILIVVLLLAIIVGFVGVRYFYSPNVNNQPSATVQNSVSVPTQALDVSSTSQTSPSDLRLESINVPQNENGYYDLLAFIGSLLGKR